MDPALLELIRRGKAVAGREVEAIIRLRRRGLNIPGVRIVSRFGRVATCRLRARYHIGASPSRRGQPQGAPPTGSGTGSGPSGRRTGSAGRPDRTAVH
jgi:hypothetical protein